jgi:hypothetical protein
MEAEPEMFGAAVAAPESSTHGASVRATTRSERLTWSSLSVEAGPAPAVSTQPIDTEVSGDRRAGSAAAHAAVGVIALLQVIWWALLAYGGLQLFAL